MQVLKRISENGELVNVALNTHGTRAVQKLIETLTSREQASQPHLPCQLPMPGAHLAPCSWARSSPLLVP